MRISRTVVIAAVVATLSAPALAFEIKDLTAETPPGTAFSYGLQQYNSGDKLTAIEALSFAAGKGITGAQWKLGNMYAEGDGVARDDVKAFEAGCDEYVTKPFVPRELLAKIRAYLG